MIRSAETGYVEHSPRAEVRSPVSGTANLSLAFQAKPSPQTAGMPVVFPLQGKNPLSLTDEQKSCTAFFALQGEKPTRAQIAAAYLRTGSLPPLRSVLRGLPTFREASSVLRTPIASKAVHHHRLPSAGGLPKSGDTPALGPTEGAKINRFALLAAYTGCITLGSFGLGLMLAGAVL